AASLPMITLTVNRATSAVRPTRTLSGSSLTTAPRRSVSTRFLAHEQTSAARAMLRARRTWFRAELPVSRLIPATKAVILLRDCVPVAVTGEHHRRRRDVYDPERDVEGCSHPQGCDTPE